MTTKRTKRREAGREAAVERCFLCGRPVTAAEQEDAYERVLTDQVPPIIDLAHEECASEAGLWEESEDAEEERPRAR